MQDIIKAIAAMTKKNTLIREFDGANLVTAYLDFKLILKVALRATFNISSGV